MSAMAENFREQIEKRLSAFSHEDIRLFAWLCAVRALPFLGAAKSFDYWKNTENGDKRQTHLFTVLKALDIIWNGTSDDLTPTDYSALNATAAASGDAHDATHVVYATSAAFVATAANFATAIASRLSDGYATDVATAVIAATTAAYGVGKRAINFEPILLEDLEVIKAGKRNFQNDTAIYGEIWENFQKALRDVDCEYWGDWYARLFKKGFILDDNDREEIQKRLNVPKRIAERGAAGVARYVTGLDEKAERLNETRVLILGEKGSGKTSLALRLKNPKHKMPSKDESTEGVDVIDWPIAAVAGQPDSEVNVHIWDFAGHVITHAAHRCFMSERCLYIVLINGRTEGDNRTEYWLEQIRNYGGDSPVLVLVNIKDKHRVDLPENTLKKEFPSIVDFYQVDIDAGGKPLEEFRKAVMKILQDNPLWKNQQISASAYKVKEALREHFEKGNEYIEREEFDQIAKKSGVKKGEHQQLLEDLRDLGICLWYGDDDMEEFGTMVLNPSWISHGIYRLINWGMNKKKTSLSISDSLRAFAEGDASKYPEEKVSFLFRLMKIYQLAFFKDENPNKIFVPLLLPVDRTDEKNIPIFPLGERLRMVYTANQALPPYTVARLAVQHSKEYNFKKSWRFGALLRWEGTDALVEESERSVTVSVKGKRQTDYISQLRDTLNGIFDDYANNRPELKYEVLIPDEWKDSMDRRLLTPMDSNKLLQPDYQIIGNASAGQKLLTGIPHLGLVEPTKTMQGYGLVVVGDIKGDLVLGNKMDDHSKHIDKSRTFNVTFENCSVDLQGNLNALAKSFRKKGSPEDIELAEELEEAASDLEEVSKEIPPDATPNSAEMKKIQTSLQKKGLLNRLKNLSRDLCDEDSELYKKVSGIRKGVHTLQELGACYNAIGQWFGLPQVPRPLLGKPKD